MTIGDKIVQVAEEFEGLVEVISNTKFDDPKTKGPDARADKLVRILRRAGHSDGWPYCSSFTEGVWVVAYEDMQAKPKVIAAIRGLLSPSVMNSYTACREAGLITKEPHKGAVGFMQSGSKWQGHAFLVTDVDSGWIRTIEGNTSPSDANERDGGIGTGGVWRKKRAVVFAAKECGLHLRGFLNPLPV
jgi:hypothetical protein